MRRDAGDESERNLQRISLRLGELLQTREARRAELLQRRERERHLGLVPRGAQHLEALRAGGGVLEQRRLADAGFAVHDDRLTLAVARRHEQSINCLAFACPPQQRASSILLEADRRPCHVRKTTARSNEGVRVDELFVRRDLGAPVRTQRLWVS